MGPGQMIALDLQTATLLENERYRQPAEVAAPVQGVAEEGRELPGVGPDRLLARGRAHGSQDAVVYRKMFNITAEEREEIIRVLARDESEAVGSMGDDTPMPVLSHHTRNLYDYFRQQFAQVTNPPIDPLRETIVMSLQTEIGPECNMFQPVASHAQQVVMNSPVLSQRKLRQIMAMGGGGRAPMPSSTCNTTRPKGWRPRCARICREAEAAVRDGTTVLLISDRYLVKDRIPIHALLATGAIHHHLVQQGLRCKCNLLIETGTARDPHHFACLIGYGATAVYPYMAYQSLYDMMRKGKVKLEARRAHRAGPQLPQGDPQGPAEDHLEDGHLHHRELSQRPAVRDRRAGRRRGRHCASEARRAASRARTSPTCRKTSSYLRSARGTTCSHRRARRPAQVRARRRVPHVQPGCDRDAAGGGEHGRLQPYQAYAKLVNERPASTLRDLLTLVPKGRADPRRRSGERRKRFSSASIRPACRWARCRPRRTKRSPSP